MERPAAKFSVGQELKLLVADPKPGKEDNVVMKTFIIVSQEWGGDNKFYSLQPEYFYRLQHGLMQTPEPMSESVLLSKVSA